MRPTSPRPYGLLLFLALLLLAVPAPVRAEDEASQDEATKEAAAESPPAAKAPKTVAVQRRPFAEYLELKGAFVPQRAVEVAYEPKVYGGPLEVVEAADMGTVVAGQLLVRFDEEAITKEIKNRERDLFVLRSRLEMQEAELRKRKRATAMQLEALATRLRRAEADFERWLEVDKPTRIARAEYGLEGTLNRLQDAVEELEQLEKMYEADDLTEETEEIVIRRTRRGLARQRQSFEWQKQGHDRLLETTIPREEKDKARDVEQKRLEYETYEVTGPADLRRHEVEFEKAKEAYEEAEKKLRDLRADRDALRVRAPVDGYAVYGAFQGNAFSGVDGMRKALEPEGRVKAHQVLFTIIQPGDVGVRTQVGEGDLLKVKVGQRAEVRPTVDGSTVLDANVSEVVRVGSGKFPVELGLQETMPELLPGYGCTIKVATYENDEALVVPATAVRRHGGAARVFQWVEGEAVPVDIEVGRTVGGRTEILAGIEAGARILEKAPEETK